MLCVNTIEIKITIERNKKRFPGTSVQRRSTTKCSSHHRQRRQLSASPATREHKWRTDESSTLGTSICFFVLRWRILVTKPFGLQYLPRPAPLPKSMASRSPDHRFPIDFIPMVPPLLRRFKRTKDTECGRRTSPATVASTSEEIPRKCEESPL